MYTETQQFNSAADLMANYAAVRNRIFSARPRPAPRPQRIMHVKAVNHGRHFNAHVIAYRMYLLKAEWSANLDAGEPPTAEEIFKRTRFKHSYALIERRICRAMGVSRHEVRSNRRFKKATMARQAIMYWCYRLTRNSLPQIGRSAGGRDHTTVLHAVRVYPVKRAEMGRCLRDVRGDRHSGCVSQRAATDTRTGGGT